MNPVKIGMIGVGSMGSSHARTLETLPNAVITAVCDINPQALEQFNDRPAIARFTDAETFFRKADIDAVIIATPHFFHHLLAVQALEHGKHVLVEKPIAVHKALAETMLKAAAEHPELKFAAMFNQRTIPAHRKLKQLLEQGELGAIRRINWTITDWFRTQNYYDSSDWRASWRGEGGGVLLNQCPHQLDLLQWFFGMPEKIRATAYFGKYHDIEVEDEVTAILEYPDGMTGVFIASTGEVPGSNRLEVAADRGKLVFEKGVISFQRTEVSVAKFCAENKLRFTTPECWTIQIPVNTDRSGQHRNIIINFLEAIQQGAPLVAPAVEGIRGLEIGTAMLLSAWKQQPVSLPLNGAEFEEKLNRLITTSRYRKKAPAAELSQQDFNQSF